MKNFKLTELDKILLRRKHSVMFEPADMAYEQSKTEKALVVSGLKNVQALGFTFSKELLEKAFHFTRDEFTALYGFLMETKRGIFKKDFNYLIMNQLIIFGKNYIMMNMI